MSLDGFVADANGGNAFIFSSMSEDRHRAEAVFIGGNGFQAARAVHHLECRTGRLVREANQFLLWSLLEKAGAPVVA